MAICINQSNLDKNYPVGRKLYIKCKGLILGNDHQNLELGISVDANGQVIDIPESLVDDYIVKANYPNPISVDTLSLATLASLYTGLPYLNKLVVIKDAEFISDDIAVPFAQNRELASFTDLTLQNCDGNKLTLRTSSYASFQPLITPSGHGYITGIYTRNNFTPVLTIRDTSDVKFNTVRCDSTLPDNRGITALATIRGLCARAADSINDLAEYKISGVVISDKNANNINASNMVIQQEDKGIMIQFMMPHNLNLGDSVVINVHHGKLSRQNSLLLISKVPLTAITLAGFGKVVQPRVATIADIEAHYADWESTLATIQQAVITGGTFSGSRPLTDGSGTLILYTRSAALFAQTWIPQGAKNFTGILSIFNETKQLQMRNMDDVQ
jgi:hypothetical protein